MKKHQMHRLAVAPMMDWTDRHCRAFHRLLSRQALLYTEMVVASAVVRGDAERLLRLRPEREGDVALQLGGSEPRTLGEATRIACQFPYREINLNVGCPSDKVRDGSFGASLMRKPEQVARCLEAMRRASDAEGGPEVTVKCRIGVDDQVPEEVLPEFIDRMARAGIRSFSIHARKAWLQGLSPKENREVPPLDHPLVHAQKLRRPDLEIVINGGISSLDQAEDLLEAGLDGVMIGRAAYHDPGAILASADRRIFGQRGPDAMPEAAALAMMDYVEEEMARGERLHRIVRHMLGLFAGRPGARAWRRVLSEASSRPGAGPELIEEAVGRLGSLAA